MGMKLVAALRPGGNGGGLTHCYGARNRKLPGKCIHSVYYRGARMRQAVWDTTTTIWKL